MFGTNVLCQEPNYPNSMSCKGAKWTINVNHIKTNDGLKLKYNSGLIPFHFLTYAIYLQSDQNQKILIQLAITL